MESIITNITTGYIVANGSSRSLAQGIETVLARARPDDADQIRSTVKDYSWAKVASAVLDEYLVALTS
jgi:hypothetical protein